MSYFNLLKQKNILRDIESRAKNKKKNIVVANKFGFEYFDGSRDQGYGGYKYDGRWKKISKIARDRYKLNKNSKVLDVGCAKGFFVKDLGDLLKSKNVFGIDISEYALKNFIKTLLVIFIKVMLENSRFLIIHLMLFFQ